MNKIEIRRPPSNAPLYVQAVTEGQLEPLIVSGEKIHFAGQLNAETIRLLDQHHYNAFVLKMRSGIEQSYYLERQW